MRSESLDELSGSPGKLDFGYSWVWTYGHLVLLVPFLALAGVAWLLGAPAWLMVVLLVPAGWAIFGFVIMRFVANFNALPEVPASDYLRDGTGDVLDLGCGLGRATIMVALARPTTRITAVDNFSASYIKDHGEAPLARNLRIAGVAQRVTVREGDLLQLPFEDETFDALVSSFAIDHTADVARALAEAKRVLRPGGQFLLLSSVASVRMVIAMLPLYIMNWGHVRTRGDWQRELKAAGFTLDDEGPLRTHGWFLMSRPPASAI
ncbi:MAG: class I SAM-dependent methyltransferase [Chloroflexi bacterium]|nr:class I SAM-dependent methyltransferase [Chloroflexota bacterium]